MLRKFFASLSFFGIAVLTLQAQNVFVMPGAFSAGQNISAFAASPLTQITAVPTGAGAFLVLTAANKFYFISTSTSVTVTDANFASVHTIGSFAQVATGAAVSPDGKRIVVAAGALHVFDTSTDTELISTAGISVGVGVNVLYVAAGLDGKSFFTVGTTTSGNSQLNGMDSTTLNVNATLAIQGTVTSITIGPNGLVYVATQNPNQLVEVNPNTLTVTTGGLISLGGPPGIPVFTPDGQYLVIISKNASVSSIALSNHQLVSSISLPSTGIPLDTLQLTGINTIAAYATQNQTLYQLIVGIGGGLSIGTFPGLANGLSSITVSNEVPGGNVNTKSSLYATATGTLYRLDLAATALTQAAVPSSIIPAALSYTAPPTNGSPTTLLGYGVNQTVAPGGTSLPLVVQALDGSGRPLSNVSVTFASNSSSAVISPVAATTGSNGNAVAYLTAPTTSGTVQVTASAGQKTATFNITVGSSATGSATGLKIVAGQGQMLPEGSNTANAASGGPGSSLIVAVTDSNGNPVSGTPVTFSITQGPGILSGGLTSETLNTDSTGRSTVDFQSAILQTGLLATGGFSQTTISATTATGSVNFYITTIPGIGNTINVPSVSLLAPTPGSTLTGQAGGLAPAGVGVRIISSLGVAIPNVGITLSNGGLDPTQNPSASCNDLNGTGVLSDQSGTITCDVLFGPRVGSIPITVNVGFFRSFASSFTINVTAGPPGKVNIVQGNNQSGSPGQTLPLALLVQVTDAAGNVLNGTPVKWQVVTAGTATLTNVSSATDINGHASALATLGNVAGTAQVTVTAGSASATFSLTVNIAAAGLTKVSGDTQTAVISTAFGSPLVVKVVDSKGSPVQGAPVAFAVSAGSATLGSATVNTDSTGQASDTVTAGSSAGSITITASTSGFSVTFNLASRLPGPTNITIVNGASFLASSGISPGGIALITGAGIASTVQGLVVANNIIGPLPTTLPATNGVSVTFNGTLAPIYYVLNSGATQQIAVQVPFEVTPGSVSVVINAAGGGSAAVTTTVQPFAPGAFTTTFGGQTMAVATRPDGSFVSPVNTAVRGENITFYVTGLGQTSPATATGSAGLAGQKVAAPLIVGINNGGVGLISANYVPGLVGVYAVTVQIPSDTATGNAQPFGLIAIDPQGNQYWMQAVPIPIR